MRTEQLRAILEAQKYKCGLSGVALTPENLEFDHIVPVSSGGGDEPSNIMAVTKAVNRCKRCLDLVEFVELCHQIAENVSIRKAKALRKKGLG